MKNIPFLFFIAFTVFSCNTESSIPIAKLFAGKYNGYRYNGSDTTSIVVKEFRIVKDGVGLLQYDIEEEYIMTSGDTATSGTILWFMNNSSVAYDGGNYSVDSLTYQDSTAIVMKFSLEDYSEGYARRSKLYKYTLIRDRFLIIRSDTEIEVLQRSDIESVILKN